MPNQPLVPGSAVPPSNIAARVSNLEQAIPLITYIFIQDADPATDPSITVKPGDLWATLT
jgi:hypothetical protein